MPHGVSSPDGNFVTQGLLDSLNIDPSVAVVASVSEAQNGSYPSQVMVLEVMGYSTSGDGGRCSYVRDNTTEGQVSTVVNGAVVITAKPGWMFSFTDGGRVTWKMSDTFLNPTMFGADPSGLADSSNAINNMFKACLYLGTDCTFPSMYRSSAQLFLDGTLIGRTLTDDSKVTVRSSMVDVSVKRGISFDANVAVPCLTLNSVDAVDGLNVEGDSIGAIVRLAGRFTNQDIRLSVSNARNASGARGLEINGIQLANLNLVVKINGGTTMGSNGTIGVAMDGCSMVTATANVMGAESAFYMQTCKGCSVTESYAWLCKRFVWVGPTCEGLVLRNSRAGSLNPFVIFSPHQQTVARVVMDIVGMTPWSNTSTIENIDAEDTTYGGYHVRIISDAPQFKRRSSDTVSTPAVPATGVWMRNKFRTNVHIKFFTGSGISSIRVRDYDALTYNAEIETSLPVSPITLGYNEEIQITYTGTASWFWIPRCV